MVFFSLVLTRYDLLTEYRILVPGPSKDRNPDYRLPWSRGVARSRRFSGPMTIIGDIERRHDFERLEVCRT
jgi:hypothetical protein